jgi:hypothetical protein
MSTLKLHLPVQGLRNLDLFVSARSKRHSGAAVSSGHDGQPLFLINHYYATKACPWFQKLYLNPGVPNVLLVFLSSILCFARTHVIAYPEWNKLQLIGPFRTGINSKGGELLSGPLRCALGASCRRHRQRMAPVNSRGRANLPGSILRLDILVLSTSW